MVSGQKKKKEIDERIPWYTLKESSSSGQSVDVRLSKLGEYVSSNRFSLDYINVSAQLPYGKNVPYGTAARNRR